MPATDEQLLKGIAAGDGEAMRALFERHATPLLRYALARTGNRSRAEDAVQETMLAAWRGAAGYRREASVRTWLFGICRNRLAELAKKGQAEVLVPNEESASLVSPAWAATRPSHPDPGGEAQQALDFWQAFGRLSEDHRDVILLVFHYGFSVRETAELLGVPEGTVKSRTYSARRRLEAELAEAQPARRRAVAAAGRKRAAVTPKREGAADEPERRLPTGGRPHPMDGRRPG